MSSVQVASAAIVAAAFLALLATVLVQRHRKQYSFGQVVLYFINTLVTRLLWRTTVSGRLPVNRGQGAVIVSNHRSGIDPLLIQLATDRVVHWMVAREYIEHPAMAWAFRILQSIPVNRGGIDTASTKAAIRLASNGALVGNFPEGRINVSDRLLLPGRPGAALIALKARVPVIPCYITGSPYNGSALGPFLMTARAHVTVGQPIDISQYYGRAGDKEVQEELTRTFLIEIAKLAGVPEFEPELAGRSWKPQKTAVD